MGTVNAFFAIYLPLILLAVTLVAGTVLQRRHLRRLDEAERELLVIPITDTKGVPPNVEADAATLVTGSVVLATDYFRALIVGLRQLLGGELVRYERLMSRARREAICRMLAQAHGMGAVAVVNVRLETSNVGSMSRNPSPMVEVVAYGTALLPSLSAAPARPPLARG